MIDYPDKVLVYNGFADMRRSIDGLSMLVHQEISAQNSQDTVFVFINKGGDKIKILHKQNTGFCLFYKRLDRGCFKINIIQNERLSLSKQQLRWLLEGLDYAKLSTTKMHKNSGKYTVFFEELPLLKVDKTLILKGFWGSMNNERRTLKHCSI